MLSAPKRGSDAVSLVVVRHGRPTTTLYWQPRLSAIKRLDLALFVDRQHDGMIGRRDVEPDHVMKLLGKGNPLIGLVSPDQSTRTDRRYPHAGPAR